MTITALPTPPQRSDGPDTFANNGDTFIAALPLFVTEANALGAQVSADAAAVALVAPGAIAAAQFQGEYSAGVTYSVGQSVSYGGDTWFAKTVNLAVTPVTGANWQKVQAIPAQAGQSGKVLGTDGNSASWVSAGDVTTAGAQTLTNKSISLGSNTITGTIAQFNLACSDADFVITASPTLTGTPTAPTATADTNTTQIATTAFVKSSTTSMQDVALAYSLAF